MTLLDYSGQLRLWQQLDAFCGYVHTWPGMSILVLPLAAFCAYVLCRPSTAKIRLGAAAVALVVMIIPTPRLGMYILGEQPAPASAAGVITSTPFGWLAATEVIGNDRHKPLTVGIVGASLKLAKQKAALEIAEKNSAWRLLAEEYERRLMAERVSQLTAVAGPDERLALMERWHKSDVAQITGRSRAFHPTVGP